MAEPYIAQITLFAGNFAPRNWAFCQGQILSIASNTALFSLLGTTFGGNGQTTFALPDLRGRYPRGTGQGPGLSNVQLGEAGGSESVTLAIAQMPAHVHVGIQSNSTPGGKDSPKGNYLAANENTLMYQSAAGPAGDSTAGNTGPAGGSQPTSIMNPWLGLNYIIALMGVYPSRS